MKRSNKIFKLPHNIPIAKKNEFIESLQKFKILEDYEQLKEIFENIIKMLAA